MSKPTPFHVPQQLKLTVADKATVPWQQLFTNMAALLNLGVPAAKNSAAGILVPQSVTISIPKLTGPGTNGSLTFTSGILTAYQAPT
jgi:hypothetical protein